MENTTQKIIPHLWFDDDAEEAAAFYTSLFGDSQVGSATRYAREGFEIHGQPEGRVMTIEFELSGFRLIGLNGGPHFTFTPAISFFVVCESEAEVDELWKAFSEGGEPLVDLDAYDWSEKYGWIQDRYGISWQLGLGELEDVGQKITPSLLFVGDQYGRAEDALTFYTSVFGHSSISGILRHGADGAEKEGTVQHAQFSLGGEMFMAMDSGMDHAFSFNEAISLLIECDSQEEVDYYWEHLGRGGDPSAQQCGWLKDRFGVSWQVSPTVLREMIQDPDDEKVNRVTRAFLRMKKFDLEALTRAYEGR
jgi:predicted 3-demethylubiquinone-9 3-methyltransferase (glyoxalase superfamily)